MLCHADNARVVHDAKYQVCYFREQKKVRYCWEQDALPLHPEGRD